MSYTRERQVQRCILDLMTTSRPWVMLVTGVALLGAGASCDKQRAAGDQWTISYPALFNACLKWDACNHPQSGSSGYCVITYAAAAEDPEAQLGPVNAFLECVEQSSNCAEVLACKGTECDDATQEVYCNGADAWRCAFGYLWRRDCSLIDRQCLTNTYQVAQCADATCSSSQAGDWCEGAVLVRCLNGLLWRYDCREGYVPGTCVEEAGEAQCANEPLTPCEESSYDEHCEGNVVVGCSGGYVQRWECDSSVYPSSCVDGEGTAYCNTDGGEPCGGLPRWTCTCAGTEVQCCLDDYWAEFDCAALGLTCQTLPDEEWAHCG